MYKMATSVASKMAAKWVIFQINVLLLLLNHTFLSFLSIKKRLELCLDRFFKQSCLQHDVNMLNIQDGAQNNIQNGRQSSNLLHKMH